MRDFGPALDVKELDADGTIAGIAADYTTVDNGGDLFLPGSATKSLAERSRVPMLLYHQQNQPVGVWNEIAEGAEGVSVKGRFAMSTVAGREAHAMAKDGALSALSVGYRAIRHNRVAGVRQISEWKLFEVSLVTVGMNDHTLVTDVKSSVEIKELRDRLAAGDRLTEREWEGLFKSMGLSNSEAERVVRVHGLKVGQGEPDAPTDGGDYAAALWAAMRGAPIIDNTGE